MCPTKSEDPEPTADEADDRFHRLAREARSHGSRSAREAYERAFWDLVWATDPWHVLVAPDAPSIGPMPAPLVAPCAIDASARGEPQRPPLRCACVFTGARRAAGATTGEFLPTIEGRRATVALAPERACDLLASIVELDAVLINPDELEWACWMRITDLIATFESRFDLLTPRMAGRFGEAVNRGGAPMRARLLRRLFLAPEWWFVVTQVRRHAPALVATASGALALPIFTDGERARRGGPSVVAALDEGEAIAIPMTPLDGTSFIRRLHERSRDEFLALLVNGVPGEPGEPAAIPVGEFLAAAEVNCL